MARPQATVPQLPGELCSLLDSLDPEVMITVGRRAGGGEGGGGRQYEEIETFPASPTTTMRIADVARRVLDSVTADGDCYFALQAFDDDGEEIVERFTWYAFAADPGQATAPDADDHLSSVEILLARNNDALARFIALFPAMAEAAVKMVDQCTNQSQMLIESMNEHMASQHELLVDVAREERKGDREKEGFKLLGRWMDGQTKERSSVHDVHVGLAARLEAEDFDKLKAHPAGKELLESDTAGTLRDAATKLVAAVSAGELKLHPSSVARIVPWMQRLASAGAAKE